MVPGACGERPAHESVVAQQAPRVPEPCNDVVEPGQAADLAPVLHALHKAVWKHSNDSMCLNIVSPLKHLHWSATWYTMFGCLTVTRASTFVTGRN